MGHARIEYNGTHPHGWWRFLGDLWHYHGSSRRNRGSYLYGWFNRIFTLIIMEKTKATWTKLTTREMQDIYGGGWFDDFKKGFKEGFDWAIGVLTDLANFIK